MGGSPSRRTSVGESVVRGRLPGAKAFGWPSTRLNCWQGGGGGGAGRGGARRARGAEAGDARRRLEPAAAGRRGEEVALGVDDVDVGRVAVLARAAPRR